MTRVPVWVRPMPMEYSAVVAPGDLAGLVDLVVADAVVGVVVRWPVVGVALGRVV